MTDELKALQDRIQAEVHANDEANARIAELEQQLTQAHDDLNWRTLQRDNEIKENDTLREQLANYVKQLDDMYGTPCEQVRHKQEVDTLREQLQAARNALAEIREVWAGSDGFVAETAPEAYQRRLLVRGYEIAVKALVAGQEES